MPPDSSRKLVTETIIRAGLRNTNLQEVQDYVNSTIQSNANNQQPLNPKELELLQKMALKRVSSLQWREKLFKLLGLSSDKNKSPQNSTPDTAINNMIHAAQMAAEGSIYNPLFATRLNADKPQYMSMRKRYSDPATTPPDNGPTEHEYETLRPLSTKEPSSPPTSAPMTPPEFRQLLNGLPQKWSKPEILEKAVQKLAQVALELGVDQRAIEAESRSFLDSRHMQAQEPNHYSLVENSFYALGPSTPAGQGPGYYVVGSNNPTSPYGQAIPYATFDAPLKNEGSVISRQFGYALMKPLLQSQNIGEYDMVVRDDIRPGEQSPSARMTPPPLPPRPGTPSPLTASAHNTAPAWTGRHSIPSAPLLADKPLSGPAKP